MTTTTATQADDFLPIDYEAPKTGGNFMKLQNGENKFRILSKPIIGWLDWKDKKPLRFAFNNKPDKPIDPKKPIKHFWAMVVWNYSECKIQILEITQSGIQKSIINLTNDADWGSPYSYDIKINRSGDGLDTEYSVNPIPHKVISDEIKQAYNDKPCDLQMLFAGEDPFAKQDIVTPLMASDLPF